MAIIGRLWLAQFQLSLSVSFSWVVEHFGALPFWLSFRFCSAHLSTNKCPHSIYACSIYMHGKQSLLGISSGMAGNSVYFFWAFLICSYFSKTRLTCGFFHPLVTEVISCEIQRRRQNLGLPKSDSTHDPTSHHIESCINTIIYVMCTSGLLNWDMCSELLIQRHL
jgi:hypothetical protein